MCAATPPGGREGEPALAEQRAGPAAEPCSRWSVPSSGKKHGEHQETEESFAKKRLISQAISRTFTPDDLYSSAGKRATLLDA